MGVSLRCEQADPVKRRSLLGACLVLAAIVLLALGYLSWNASIRRDRAELPRYGGAPEFDLKDQNQTSVDKQLLHGKIWVANFVEVAKPGASAVLSSRCAELDQNFGHGEQLTLISIVIPAPNQNGPVLKDLSQHYLASSRWHFVAGPSDEVNRLLEQWKLVLRNQNNGNLTSRLFLVDSESVVRGVYDGRSPEAVQQILGDVGTLLRSRSK
jgi:cytochrome oxidase Cu insertion factor (SCO1/SenC/PrrC family)